MDLTRAIEGIGEGSVLAWGGLAIGAAFGFAAQRSRFCLRAAAIEFWHGHVEQQGRRLADGVLHRGGLDPGVHPA